MRGSFLVKRYIDESSLRSFHPGSARVPCLLKKLSIKIRS